MNRIALKAAFMLSFITLCLGACAPKHSDYSSFRQLDHAQWLYGNALHFSPADDDSVNNGVLTVAVCHNDRYPFRNLWLEIKRTDVKGHSVIDTVNMQLADVYGNWLGKGIGGRYQSEVKVTDNFSFFDSAQVDVRHIMRADTLVGITDLGVTIRSPKP